MITRDVCYECGRKESFWSAFKQWLRWTKLGRWWRPVTAVPEYQKYFSLELLSSAARSMEVFSKHRRLPADQGATTAKFKSK